MPDKTDNATEDSPSTFEYSGNEDVDIDYLWDRYGKISWHASIVRSFGEWQESWSVHNRWMSNLKLTGENCVEFWASAEREHYPGNTVQPSTQAKRQSDEWNSLSRYVHTETHESISTDCVTKVRTVKRETVSVQSQRPEVFNSC